MNFQEAKRAWEKDRARLASFGIHMPSVVAYIPEGFGRDINFAMDALPTTLTGANAGIPAFLATLIDPEVLTVLFSPNEAANICTEVQKGNWLDETASFPLVEHEGEVTSYGDFNEGGHAGANTNWLWRQSYLFQTKKEYGEREIERAGLAKINWLTEIDRAAATRMDQFMNYSYFFGVRGLQNYGLLNDPGLSASLSPCTKVAGNGNRWVYNGQINATANEIYQDIQALFLKLVQQSGGIIKANSEMTLALGTEAEVALTATNSFNVNVSDLLKKNFPNITIKSAVQFNGRTSYNPDGNAAGGMAQLIATTVEGKKTLYCAYNEKMRTHPIIKALSSFKQKVTGGTWGTIIRQPFAVSSMVGLS